MPGSIGATASTAAAVFGWAFQLRTENDLCRPPALRKPMATQQNAAIIASAPVAKRPAVNDLGFQKRSAMNSAKLQFRTAHVPLHPRLGINTLRRPPRPYTLIIARL